MSVRHIVLDQAEIAQTLHARASASTRSPTAHLRSASPSRTAAHPTLCGTQPVITSEHNARTAEAHRRNYRSSDAHPMSFLESHSAVPAASLVAGGQAKITMPDPTVIDRLAQAEKRASDVEAYVAEMELEQEFAHAADVQIASFGDISMLDPTVIDRLAQAEKRASDVEAYVAEMELAQKRMIRWAEMAETASSTQTEQLVAAEMRTAAAERHAAAAEARLIEIQLDAQNRISSVQSHIAEQFAVAEQRAISAEQRVVALQSQVQEVSAAKQQSDCSVQSLQLMVGELQRRASAQRQELGTKDSQLHRLKAELSDAQDEIAVILSSSKDSANTDARQHDAGGAPSPPLCQIASHSSEGELTENGSPGSRILSPECAVLTRQLDWLVNSTGIQAAEMIVDIG